MPPSRISALALGADVVAVIVFTAIGRASHAEPFDIVGLAATAAPFLVGLGVAWATPVVRADPASLRAGGMALAGAALLGLAIRFGFTGRLPFTFVMITITSLGALLLGWRGLSQAVSRRATDRVP